MGKIGENYLMIFPNFPLRASVAQRPAPFSNGACCFEGLRAVAHCSAFAARVVRANHN